MMKTGFTFIFILLCIGMYAQDKPVTFGIKGGLNIANVSGDEEFEIGEANISSSLEKKAVLGYQFGVTVDFAITPELFIQSGLELTTKGAKQKIKISLDEFSINMSTTARPMYLQVPIHIAYKMPISETSKVFFHAGPYIAYGINGKIKPDGLIKWPGGSMSLKEMANDPDIRAAMEKQGLSADILKDGVDVFGDDGWKRFDFGLGGGVGIEFGKIVIDLSYDLGLVKVTDGSDAKNMKAHLTLGYKF